MKKANGASAAHGGNELVFLPLGGAGEIGMNLNAYGFGPAEDRKWIIVDIGVTFGDLSTPGVEVIMADPAYLEEYVQDVLAIVLTHAHEDHIGAIGHLWPRLKKPIYATPFTARLVADKLKEAGIEDEAEVTVLPLGARFSVGPFDLEYVTLTHSIPEPNGLAIRTPLGLVLHTGDWKIDPEPLIGDVTDEARLRALADEGVIAMVCDSTNALSPGVSGSEGDVRENLRELIAKEKGRVAVACFASNVARLESVIMAAEAAGRRVCLVGRSMLRITGAAKEVGLLQEAKDFVAIEEAGFLPPDRILYLCTGSQGEARAALTRIARDDHRHVALGEGDTVIFSSRVIPGNEVGISELQNLLADKGIKIVTADDAPVRPIHVSGHPKREELRQMYRWVRPRTSIPVHGERRHLIEHAKLAKELQVQFAIPARNGEMIRLAPGEPEIIDETPSGRLYLDGPMLIPAGSAPLKERMRMAFNGHISIAMSLDPKTGLLDDADIRARGLAEPDGSPADASLNELLDLAEDAVERLSKSDRRDPDVVEEAVERVVRKAAGRIWGKYAVAVDAIVLGAE